MGDTCPELTKLTSNPEILRIIECPVCHEVPFPPIYQCITGHNICKLCKPKLQKCPICQKVFSDARNYSVEHMVLASSHSCAYKDQGCKIVGTGEALGDHIKICQYRPFMCPGNGTWNCAKTIPIKLSEAKDHFLATHKSTKTASKRTHELPFTCVNEDHSKLNKDAAWPPCLVEVDGKCFMGQVYIRSEIFCCTLFCLGTEEDAANYKAKITFSSEKENDIGIQWRVRVQPIMKSEQLRDGNEMKGVLILSCSFNDFKKVATRDDVFPQYKFQIEYQISKCE